MVYKIIREPRALEDLRDIVSYFRRHDENAARNFGVKLIPEFDGCFQH